MRRFQKADALLRDGEPPGQIGGQGPLLIQAIDEVADQLLKLFALITFKAAQHHGDYSAAGASGTNTATSPASANPTATIESCSAGANVIPAAVPRYKSPRQADG